MLDPMRRGLHSALGLLFAAAAHAGPQVAQMPPRDRPTAPLAPQLGTASIKGRVVDGQTGSGIIRARVRLMGSGGQRAPILTDESGAFAFTELTRGSYTLVADKSTYVQARYPDTGETFRTMGRPIQLADGQVLDRLTLTMYHGGVIAGRVLDTHGDPLEGAPVQALRMPNAGRGRPQMRSGTSTNDIGEFRLAHLERGKYLILVMPRGDAFSEGMGPPSETDADRSQPAATFYPGVQAIDQAQPITLERGSSATGLDFTVIEGPSAVVTGTVLGADGQPVSGGMSISVRPVLPGMPGSGFGTIGTGVRPDGTFRLRLTPGEYDLEARRWQPGANGPSPGTEQFGSVRLAVNGDVSGLAIQLGTGARISGRIVLDGTSPLPTVPPQGGQMQLASASPDMPNCRMGRAELSADLTFTIDGVFGTCTVRPNGPFGRWSAKSVIYNGNEMLDQTITFGAGQRFRDVQVILTDKRTEVTLHVTDEHAQSTREFVGVLFAVDKARWTDGSRYVRPLIPRPDPPPGVVSGGGPTAGPTGGITAGVITLSGGVSSASTFMSSSQFIGPALSGGPPTRPDTIAGLPPGDYFAVAVDDMAPDMLRDPETLERLSRGAARVTLAEGAQLDVSLRRTKLSDLVPDR